MLPRSFCYAITTAGPPWVSWSCYRINCMATFALSTLYLAKPLACCWPAGSLASLTCSGLMTIGLFLNSCAACTCRY